MNKLDSVWEPTTLGNVAQFVMGQAPPGTECNKVGIGTPFVKAGEFGETRPVIREWTTKPLKLARTTDVLICVVGATSGKLNLGADCAIGRSVAAIRPKGDAIPEFLHYQLIPSVSELRRASVGSAQGVISKEMLSSIPIVLPGIDEQRRLVRKLDELFLRSDSVRQELARIPKLVERYKQAILAAAFRGKLTAEWRSKQIQLDGISLRRRLIAEKFEWMASRQVKSKMAAASAIHIPDHLPVLPESWTWMSVEELATKVVDGVHKKPHYIESGVPFLTVRNLTGSEGISFDECRFVSPEDHAEFVKRTSPEAGDILITKDGTLGIVRAVRTDRQFSIFVSLALVKPLNRSMTNYLELALSSPILQGQMVGVGTGLQHIHLNDLRRDLVPIAPEEERDEIVRRVIKQFALIERAAAEHKKATPLIDRLEQATLAMAFRGELVF